MKWLLTIIKQINQVNLYKFIVLSDIYQPSLEFNPAVLELYDSDNNN